MYMCLHVDTPATTGPTGGGCVYICIHAYIYKHIPVYLYMCLCIYLYIYMCVCAR